LARSWLWFEYGHASDLGRISQAANARLRQWLFVGAMSVIRFARQQIRLGLAAARAGAQTARAGRGRSGQLYGVRGSHLGLLGCPASKGRTDGSLRTKANI
jgi:hypothetical protein